MIVAVTLLSLGGCADQGVAPTAPEVADPIFYAMDVQPIWDTNCVGCHGQNGNGGLDLRAGLSRANLVGIASPNYMVLRVVGGDPSTSVLYAKLTDTGTYGPLMPQGGPMLSAESLEKVRRWIAGGALDN